MALRLVEFLVPAGQDSRLAKFFDEVEVIDQWRMPVEGARTLVRALAQSEQLEQLIDDAQDRFGSLQGFRLVVQDIRLTAPKVVEPEPETPEEPNKPARTYGTKRLSRQELLEQMSGAMRFDVGHVSMVVLSIIVAAAGLLNDNVAVVIAAMVIAPLLGPNIALALATTTGDGELAKRAMWVNVKSIALALGIAIVIGVCAGLARGSGWFGGPTVFDQNEVLGRTDPELGDFALALAAGAAGTLSFTSGVPGTLIGVMVAVALMPPLIVVGLELSQAAWVEATSAAVLLATNVICVNLASVVTFLVQGVRPRRWWEAERARKASRRALCVWASLFVGLLVLVWARFRGPLA